jgi:hypothetical protein
MEQLSMLDAGFLQAEDSDRHVSLAIGAISVLAEPMPDFDSLVTGPRRTHTVGATVHASPAHAAARSRRSALVDDANLDISHHVRRAALPRPGDDAALFRWVAEVMERHLDRDRPPWECWIVDGLPNNR